MARACQVLPAVVIVACFLLGLPCAFAQDAERLDIIHGPYLQAVTESSATVVWFTNKNCVSRVEYAPADAPSDSNEVKTAVASHHGLVDANVMVHRVSLTGLKPGVEYRYRVVSREIVKFDPYEITFGDAIMEGPYRVQTWDPQKEGFSFCVVNDIHENAGRLDCLLNQVPLDTIDMVFLNGDMIDHWSRENQPFDGFLDLCVRRFARETPLVYVRGNHETRGARARDLIDSFPTPGGRYYYAFRHGPVSFLVLDTGEDKPDSNKEYSGLVDFDAYRAEQTQWLGRIVQDEWFRTARYRVVLMHMPPSTDARAYGASQVHTLWSPILNEARIDLVLCGHTHRLARIAPNEWGNHYPILINAPDMVVQVGVSASRLEVTVKKADGQIVDTTAVDPRSGD
ncbi:MAG: FN3 domain-containing metallophosphoesterase family protein [Phycisphaerales bacterium]